ncbi:M1 family metallopeptidase [Maribacter sp. X9]|uniref:M1 family metallopeptidase n=1 Tax=Maribacter sp. X9 TaxID=3402159 RepID=UPI003AF37FA2
MRSLSFILILLFFVKIYGQHQDKVDFIHADVHIVPNATENMIKGIVTYEFKVLAAVDSIFLDAHQMEFEKVSVNSKKVDFRNNGKILILDTNFKGGRKYSLQIEYSCSPKQALYYVGFDDDIQGNEQIWTQGQGKYTSYWLPSFDDMTEKLEFDLTITFDKKYKVIANGKLQHIKEEKNQRSWQFNMEKPMSSYLVAFAIGDFEKQKLISDSGVPIENYYYPTDKVKVEPTYRYSKQLFDFLEQEIGVPYPWQNYKQVPVHDFLYAGMENTSTTLFSDAYIIDSTSFIDRNYVNINAHELAHQWFGDLVTEVNGEHHWLQEGFATYYAYLAEKEIFGDDHFYWKLFHTAKSLNEISISGEGESLLDPKASSLTFYEKGAWALVMLRNEIGSNSFQKGIQNYLSKYQFKNVTVSNFIDEMELSSGKNLTEFRTNWLESIIFPWEEIYGYLLERSNSIKQYDQVIEASSQIKEYYKDEVIEEFWKDDTSVNLKKQLILDFKDRVSDQKLSELIGNEHLEVRQSLALSRDKIYTVLKPIFETMLKDESYVTIEAVLYKLWTEFPENRIEYLDATKDVIGLPNKNIRLLWLTMALVTSDYQLNQKRSYLKELQNYTASVFNPEVRQSAFEYLFEIKMLNEESLKNLIKATNHYSWQFRNFSRRLLDKTLKDENLKTEIESITKHMSVDDLSYLKTKLELP